ncbi:MULTISPECIES: AI-2E family transporter [Rhodopseudomonas]|uniref:AI-2E family transporter n=1 Tax=Rhodopseudomonas TaxID=1073 RepID=UPI000A45ADEE|nr:MULTISPECIES: AI-2E family transporter [Rhodopseudomonas]MDF3812651.1 AI-2E family transporter [Rhodopseudomonas sp. BAL398]WOK18916.1 AI-2E family transporter [Rhodopseudomonas sp. BAL398]
MADTITPLRLPQPPGTTLINLAVAALIIAALYVGREVLVPVALAVLFSFVLAPFVIRLQSWRVPRTVAVLIAVFIGFSVIFSLGGLIVSQANRLAGELPGYQQTLREKIEGLRGVAAGGSSTLERASRVLRELDSELKNPSAGRRSGNLTSPNSVRPIPVEIRQPDPGTLSTLVAIIQPLIQPLTTTGIVVIFVIFILLQRQDLRNRFIRLAGSHDMQRTTAALDDAGQRLSRLFLSQMVINATFGLLIGVGLSLIGVPSAPLWGVVAMVLRFVPYVGSPISAVFPLILAAAVGTGWSMLLMTAGLFVTLQLFTGQVIEPMVFGRSAGLSPVAIVLSASFWTWLWGPIGLVLATPLTVCLVVIGRHVDRLQFFDVLLGNEPALTPPQLLYQRLLAGDPVEASQQAQLHLDDASLENYYDTTMLDGLRLAAADVQLGRLGLERIARILDTVTEVVEDLEPHENRVDEDAADDKRSDLSKLDGAASNAAVAVPEAWTHPNALICIPGAGKLDEAAALILTQILRRRGIGASAEHADALSLSRAFSLDTSQAKGFCLCYVSEPSEAMVRYALRRLSRIAKQRPVVVARFGDGNDLLETLAPGISATAGDFTHTAEVVMDIAVHSSRADQIADFSAQQTEKPEPTSPQQRPAHSLNQPLASPVNDR